MQAVVTAGGAGTRLRPLTTAVPKALLPIVGEPMLSRVVRLLSDHGAERCVVTLQHQASVVLKYFSSDRVEHVDLRFLTEPRPLGTAGSVRYALNWLEDDDILVISGDCLTDMDLRSLYDGHVASGADLTMALARRADPRDFGVVTVDPAGRVLSLVEKPSWGEVADDTVNTGIYIVNQRVLWDPGRRAERLGPGHHSRAAGVGGAGLRQGAPRVLGGRGQLRHVCQGPA
jgi:mannose-1-phosphate guanylyltransferase/phosphomannomutase